MKKDFYPSDVLDEELFEILTKNMDGFLDYYSDDEENFALRRLTNGVDWIKSYGEPTRTAGILKNIATTDKFVELKVLDGKEFDEHYNIENFEKTLKHYREDGCLKVVRKEIEETEKEGGDKRFTPLLKDFLKIANKCLDDCEVCLAKYKQFFKYEVVEDK